MCPFRCVQRCPLSWWGGGVCGAAHCAVGQGCVHRSGSTCRRTPLGGNSPRHTTDPSPQRKGRPLPPPGQSGSRFPPNTPWSLSPFEGVPGGNTPQTVFGPLTNTTQKPTNRFTAREGPLMTPTPHGHQFAQHPHTLPTYSSEPFRVCRRVFYLSPASWTRFCTRTHARAHARACARACTCTCTRVVGSAGVADD